MRIRQTRLHGNIRWLVDFKDGKGRRRRRFFPDHASAIQFSQTITYDIPTKLRGPALGTRHLFNAYLDQTQSRRMPEVQQSMIYRARQILLGLDHANVQHAHQLGAIAFNALVAHLRSRGLRESTIYDYASLYRAVIRWGIQRGLVPAIPLNEIALPLPQETPGRYLSMAEIAQLLGHLTNDPLELPSVLGIYQGLRRGEVCRLRIRDMDLPGNRLTVAESKTKTWRTIQLHPQFRSRMPDPPPASEFLCLNARGAPWREDWLTHAFRRAADALGPAWSGVTFHTLRHTCASQMAATGKYTLYQIGRFLGHRTVLTTQKYAHLLPDQVKPDW